MAKRIEAQPPTRGKIKIRYFEVEVDGETEAIQDGLRALNAALARPNTNAVTPRVIEAVKPAALIEDVSDPGETSTEEEIGEGAPQTSGLPVPVGAKKAPRKKPTPPTPEILQNVDFDAGAAPWKIYAKQKSTTSIAQKIAVVATWFKRFRSLDKITVAHAYTAFKLASWSTPNDLGQFFRDAKRNNDWFKSDGSGNWEITIIGLNYVEDKLGKAGE